MFTQAISDARTTYDALGYDTLPLLPNTKDAFLKNWQNRKSSELWQHAPEHANIGIRCGGKLHVAGLDADNKTAPRTSEHLVNFFTGLGLNENDYPNVATPNEGQHFYFAFADQLAGDYCHLSPAVGAGEFRYGSGAYLAAPPSQLGERKYHLDSGDFAKLPQIALEDLRPILAREILSSSPNAPNVLAELLNPPSKNRTPSRKAFALLRGNGMDEYHSRSEAEQAIITSLVNSGFDYDEILTLFFLHPCAGKFSELNAKNRKNARRWLRHSYENAVKWTTNNEGKARQLARAAMQWADAHIWTGRTGEVDKQVFIAHAKLCYRAGRMIYAAGVRELAELTGVGVMTAARATHRLCTVGLIVLEQEATFNLAATYRIVRTDTLSNYSYVGECISKNNVAHDLFRRAGLGKVAFAVWNVLQTENLTAKEIIAKTGRGGSAVNRALERMFRLQMLGVDLSERGNVWRALENVDLDAIARELGTLGMGARQRKEHERQRAARRKWSETYLR